MNDMLDRRILPFLWVHGESEEVYREMVKAIYDANIRAFCVEARPHEGFCQEPWWRDSSMMLEPRTACTANFPGKLWKQPAQAPDNEQFLYREFPRPWGKRSPSQNVSSR